MAQSAKPVVFVTGAGRGIGKTLATGFAHEGYRVGVGSTTMALNEAVAAAIVADGGEALPIEIDVADERSEAAAVGGLVERFGRIDVLINNAALKPGFVKDSERLLKDLPLATWQRVLGVNITGAFLCARACANVMMEQDGGSIINVSTLSAVNPREGEPAYAVSKAALNMLTKVHAMEVGQHGVAVNDMAVGFTLDAEQAGSVAPERRARAMRPEAWLPLALHLAHQTPAEMNGEVIDAMAWNEAHGHGGRDVWGWGGQPTPVR